MELSEQKLLEATDSLNHITSYTNELTDKLNAKTALLKRLKGVNEETRQRETRRLSDLLADDYFTYCLRVQSELPIYKDRFSNAAKLLANVHKIYKNWMKQEESNIISKCKELKDATESTINHTITFTESVKDIPSLTTKIIKAKKEVVKTHGILESELVFTIQLLDEIINEKTL